jgi:competence protein ComEC
MLLNIHIFKILLAFCLGLLFASGLSVHWVIVFTIWATSLLSLLVSIHFGRQLVLFRKWIGLNLLIVFFLSGAFSYQYSQPVSQRNHFSHYFLQSDAVLAEVIDIEGDTSGYRKMIVEVEAVIANTEVKPTLGKLLCYVSWSSAIQTGSTIQMKPRVKRIENDNNPGEFDAEKYWSTQGIEHISFVDGSRVKIIEKGSSASRFWNNVRDDFSSILNPYLSKENQVVAEALVLGDKSGLSNEQRNAYANAGAMHVLAVSGMHVGILLAFLQWFFYRIKWLRKRGYFIFAALIILWSFAFLTGLSASVLRASIMFTVLAIGQLRGYSFFSLNALFVAGLILLFIDPMSFFTIGFQLSFLAMLGISFFFKPLQNLVNSRYKLVNYIWDGTALGIAAQIGTIPISLYYFHQFPNYFLITNLGLIFLAGISMVSVIILLMTFWIPVVGEIVGYFVDTIFSVLNVFISWINTLPGVISKGFDPSLFWVVIVYVGISFSVYFWNRQRLFKFRITLMLLFISGVILILNRENSIASREIVFLNHKEKVVFIKEPKILVCLFEQDKLTEDDLNFLAESYSKQMGVDVIYKPLKHNIKASINKNIELIVNRQGWEFDYYGESILFTRNKSKGMMIKQSTDESSLTTRFGAIALIPSDKQP